MSRTPQYHQPRWQLFKESQHIAPLQLAANDHLAININAMHLKNRLRNIETDCLNRLHGLFSIGGALTAPTFMALTCRWRSRPQHQKRILISVKGGLSAE